MDIANAPAGAGKHGADAVVTIAAPNIQRVALTIRGVAPLVMNRFPQEAQEMMRAKQQSGSTTRKGTKREAKDFMRAFEQSRHVSTDGWDGIPAGAFRKGMVSACRLVNFKMTIAKLSVFVDADGFDRVDGTPLVRITKGEPRYVEHFVRNSTGVADIRARAMFDPGWEASVKVSFDGDQFTATDVVNLMSRVGAQVGIGAGRPDSTASAGMGWGVFEIVNG